MSMQTEPSEAIEQYLRSLRAALGRLPETQQLEIVAEIESHVRERLSSASHPAVAEVLNGLGKPEQLAEQYLTDLNVRAAARSHSPVKIFRAARTVAFRGLKGSLIFVIALIGYGFSASFYVSGLLKPLFPYHIGFWVGPNQFFIGMSGKAVPGAHELFGQWFIMFSLLAGFASLFLTTEVLRLIFKKKAAGRSAPGYR